MGKVLRRPSVCGTTGINDTPMLDWIAARFLCVVASISPLNSADPRSNAKPPFTLRSLVFGSDTSPAISTSIHWENFLTTAAFTLFRHLRDSQPQLWFSRLTVQGTTFELLLREADSLNDFFTGRKVGPTQKSLKSVVDKYFFSHPRSLQAFGEASPYILAVINERIASLEQAESQRNATFYRSVLADSMTETNYLLLINSSSVVPPTSRPTPYAASSTQHWTLPEQNIAGPSSHPFQISLPHQTAPAPPPQLPIPTAYPPSVPAYQPIPVSSLHSSLIPQSYHPSESSPTFMHSSIQPDHSQPQFAEPNQQPQTIQSSNYASNQDAQVHADVCSLLPPSSRIQSDDFF